MKTIIVVPVMYSVADLREILNSIPEDFDKESNYYWSYLENKLLKFPSFVSSVIIAWFEDTVDYRARRIVEILKGREVKVYGLEKDLKALVGEVRAWYIMTKINEGVGKELFDESNSELSQHLNKMIDGLKDGDRCVIFLDPSCKPSFHEGLQIIRMLPFDPEDYIVRHIIKQRLSKSS